MRKLWVVVLAVLLLTLLSGPLIGAPAKDTGYVPPKGVSMMSEKGVFVEVPGSNGYCVNLEVSTPSGPQIISLVDRFSQARNQPVWMLRSNLRAQFTFLAMQVPDPAARQRAIAAAQNVIFEGEPLPDDGRLFTVASCLTLDCNPDVCIPGLCSPVCSNCLKGSPGGGTPSPPTTDPKKPTMVPEP